MLSVLATKTKLGFALGLLALLVACAPTPSAQAPLSTVPPTEAIPTTTALPPSLSAVPADSPPRATAGDLAVLWTSTSPDGQWTATASSDIDQPTGN